MKKAYIIAMALALCTVANAQNFDFTTKSNTTNEKATRSAVMVAPTTVNEDGVTTFNDAEEDLELLRMDEEYTSTTDFTRFYADKSHISLGSHPRPLTVQWQQTNGFFIDINGGVCLFDNYIEPTVGLAAGYQGRWYQVDLAVSFQRNHYTMESDRPGAEFLGLNTYVGVKAKLLDVANHHFQVWGGPRIGYVLNMDYHETYLGDTVTETETEIITTKHSSIVDLKASTFGVDVCQLQMVYKPKWSAVQFVAQASYGWQQRFYADGNRWSSNWNISAGIRLNLLGFTRHTNQHLVNSLGLTKSDLKALRRASK